jgi:hypothetical protein
MDAGMVTAICTGVAAIIAAATPVVIELLRERSKQRSKEGQNTQSGEGMEKEQPQHDQ